jgi:hypothetical protein
MRFQRLVAQINSPFKKVDYPGTSGDHRLPDSRKSQHGDDSKGPKRTGATVKHKTAPDNYPLIRCSRQALKVSRISALAAKRRSAGNPCRIGRLRATQNVAECMGSC